MFFVLLLELHVPGYTIKIRKYFILLEENTKSVIVSLRVLYRNVVVHSLCKCNTEILSSIFNHISGFECG